MVAVVSGEAGMTRAAAVTATGEAGTAGEAAAMAPSDRIGDDNGDRRCSTSACAAGRVAAGIGEGGVRLEPWEPRTRRKTRVR